MLSLWLVLSQVATSAPVSVGLECDDCGVPAQDVRALEAWLSKGLEQSGHPATPADGQVETATRVVVRLSRSGWEVSVSGPTPLFAVVPASDFHVASIETLHMVESLLEQQRLASSTANSRETSADVTSLHSSLATTEPTLPVDDSRPPSPGEAPGVHAGSERTQDHIPASGVQAIESSYWQFRPTASLGGLYVDVEMRYSVALGARLVQAGAAGLGAEVQFSEGSPLSSLTVRDYVVRLGPSVTLAEGSLARMELGLWAGAAYHTTRFNDDPPNGRWQAVLGLPATLWFDVGAVAIGVRTYGQLNPAWYGLTHLTNEPYQWGLDLLIGWGR